MTKKKKHIKIEKKQDNWIVIIFIFAVVGFIIYSNSFSSPFVLDDREVIIDNRDLRYDTIFTNVTMLRYVGYVTFALNYRFNGLHTTGYHVVNILIHIINASLVYLLFRMIISFLQYEEERNYYYLIPASIGLIFLVHPIQTQAVTYTVQRFTSLAALFALLSIIFYVKFRISSPSLYRFYALSLFSALLAFKTKENTATLPLMMLLLELFLFTRTTFSLKKRILLLIPFFLLVAVIPASFMDLNKKADLSTGNILSELKEKSYETTIVTRSHYLFTEFRVIVTYCRLLLVPINQSIHYYLPWSQSFFELKTFLSFCFIAVLIVLSIIALKKYKEISLCVFWFFIFLLVESSIIPIQDPLYEHRLYLPSVGFIGAIVFILSILMKRFNPKIFAITIVLIAILFSALTFKRNEIWKDELTLWKDAVSIFPQNPLAHASLGTVYSNRNMYDAAIEELQLSIKLYPDFINAHGNLAFAYLQKGFIEKAINEYKTAIRLAPKETKGYYSLAVLYYRNGRIDESFELLQQAHNLDRSHPMVNSQLGIIYCVRNNYDDALASFSDAIKVDPHNAEIMHNYGVCLLQIGRIQEARARLLKSLEFGSATPKAYYFIALTYDKEKDLKNAASYYRQFLSKTSENSNLVLSARERLLQHEK